jgi:hypothetical protein
MRYDHLDPAAEYKVRIVYVGRGPKIRLIANNDAEVHPWLDRPSPMKPIEFDIPQAAVHTGTLTLRWHLQPDQGGFDAEVPIAEVFLIRK